MKTKKKIYEYWNSRAIKKNKNISGSNDELLHQFETKCLLNLVNKNSGSVLMSDVEMVLF